MTLGAAVARMLTLTAALGTAPLQCRGGGAGPEFAIEETPAEALYELAGVFKKRGDRAAWRTTLEQLCERYPGSREATMARAELDVRDTASTP